MNLEEWNQVHGELRKLQQDLDVFVSGILNLTRKVDSLLHIATQECNLPIIEKTRLMQIRGYKKEKPAERFLDI